MYLVKPQNHLNVWSRSTYAGPPVLTSHHPPYPSLRFIGTYIGDSLCSKLQPCLHRTVHKAPEVHITLSTTQVRACELLGFVGDESYRTLPQLHDMFQYKNVWKSLVDMVLLHFAAVFRDGLAPLLAQWILPDPVTFINFVHLYTYCSRAAECLSCAVLM